MGSVKNVVRPSLVDEGLFSLVSQETNLRSVEFYFSPDRRLYGFAYVFRSRVTYSSFVKQRSKIGVVLVNEDQLVALS